jgi:hypothetical protein
VKRWLTTIAVGLTLQACTAMDGEYERIQKKPAAASEAKPEERAHDGTQPPSADSSAPVLQSADAGTVVTTSVECGGKVCSGGTPFCCAASDTSTCVDTTTTACTGGRFLMRCDGASDCATGEVCCGWWDDRPATPVFESACTAASACQPFHGPNDDVGVGIVCMDASECPSGKTCTDYVNDWEGKRVDMKAAICTL